MTSEDRLAAGRVVLVGLFVTSLVTAQLTASKILMFQLPFGLSLPHTGSALVMPGAALAYALTFFASDCYSELYGRRAAQVMVNVGFAMTLVMLGLVYTTIEAPVAPFSPVGQEQFSRVLWSSANVVVGSLLAYVVSQNWDVLAFHALRERTDGAYLWLRNVGSTATSQAIDTVIFITVAFWAAPTFFGVGTANSLDQILGLLVGQYVLKLLIAVLDTPFVYGVVGAFRDRGLAAPNPASD
ncbi:queuosine precursor transporter [Halobacterium litoreum]|uniref:Probable queuosine precursor transporter n=1 Tax=Halobacterium litoreum TaxID=2039234 RepID=A0ABD5NFD7_9EURY|nr:queuosine precursor transporter [Halobacterium litoreum]UHH13196.1 queuosine precursor transporter [Halobacterium litoreum]